MKKLLALALLSACSLFATNFAFVQDTPGTASGSTSQAFGSNNTAGNIIIALVYYTSTATVSDSQGNVYTKIQATTVGSPLMVFAALHINAGANTITASAGGGILGLEYSSSSSVYFVCPATSQAGAIVRSAGSNVGDYVTPVSFSSPSEVMTVFGGTLNGTGTFTTSAGAIREQGTVPFNFGSAFMGGDNDVASMTTSYSVTLLVGGTGNGSRIGAFISLTHISGCTGAGPASNVFSILY